MIDFAPDCSTKKDKNKNNQHKNTLLQHRIPNPSLDIFLMFASMSSYGNLTVLILHKIVDKACCLFNFISMNSDRHLMTG